MQLLLKMMWQMIKKQDNMSFILKVKHLVAEFNQIS